MSADNGIYIGEFPIIRGLDGSDDDYEYLVIEASAIENCVLDDKYPMEMEDAYRFLYFGSPAKSFSSKEDAWLFAAKWSEDFDILEYGVSLITFDRPLKMMDRKEAEKIAYGEV